MNQSEPSISNFEASDRGSWETIPDNRKSAMPLPEADQDRHNWLIFQKKLKEHIISRYVMSLCRLYIMPKSSFFKESTLLIHLLWGRSGYY